LEIARSFIHFLKHLLFCFKFLLSLLGFFFLLLLHFLLLFYLLIHASYFLLIFLFLLHDHLYFLLYLFDAFGFQFVSLHLLLIQVFNLLVVPFTDSSRDLFFCLDFSFQTLNLLFLNGVVFIKESLGGLQQSLCVGLLILKGEGGLCLGLVEFLLEIQNFLVVLSCLLSLLILCFFKVLINLLDLDVKFLFLHSQLFVHALLLNLVLDIGLGIHVGEVLDLLHKLFNIAHEHHLIVLDLLLVTINVGIVLQDSAEVPSLGLQVTGDLLDLLSNILQL